MDARTAEITEFFYDALKKIVKRITAKVSGVTKVVYDTVTKLPSTIEYEQERLYNNLFAVRKLKYVLEKRRKKCVIFTFLDTY